MTDLTVVNAWLGRLTGPCDVVLEATLYWAWLEQQLPALGCVVQVAHPFLVKLIWHARTKTDPIEARKLTELARVHLLPAIWIPDPVTRAAAAPPEPRVSRAPTHRAQESHSRLSRRREPPCPALDLYGRAGRAWLVTVAPSCVATSIACSRISISSPRISRASTSTSNETLGRIPSPSACKTIPGVGPFGALLLQAEIGPLTRFHSAQELAA